MPSQYLSRAALDSDTELPKTGLVAGTSAGEVAQTMNVYGAVQALEAAVGTAGSGGTLNPTNPGDLLVCTSSGATHWRPTAPNNSQAGTTYTLALTDAGKAVDTTSATAVVLTVPPNASVAFPIGAVVWVSQVGAGQVTLTPGSGVTLRSAPGTVLATRGQYATVWLRKRATDEWMVAGDLVNVGFDQRFVRKTADETVTSSTTLQDDNHLLLAVDANATYDLEGFVIYDGDNAADMQIGWSGPAGATLDWVVGAYQTGVGTTGAAATIRQALATISSAEAAGITTTASKTVARPQGLLIVGGTAGTLTMRWAQLVSSATATTVYTGSWLRLKRVA